MFPRYFFTHFCRHPPEGLWSHPEVKPAKMFPASSAAIPSGRVPGINDCKEPSRALPIPAAFIFALQSFHFSSWKTNCIFDSFCLIDINVQKIVAILTHCAAPAEKIMFHIHDIVIKRVKNHLYLFIMAIDS